MKRLKKIIAGIMSGLLLFAACPIHPAARAAEPPVLPDTLTPEMAKAYGQALFSDEYYFIRAAGILLMSEEKYPVLCVWKAGEAPSVWIYNAKTEACEKVPINGGMNIVQIDDHIEIFQYDYRSWVQPPRYEIRVPYGAGFGEDVFGASLNEEESLISYTVESGNLQEFYFFKTAHRTVPCTEDARSFYDQSTGEWVASKDPWSMISLSKNGGASQTITESEYTDYLKKHFNGLRGDKLVQICADGISFPDTAVIYAEAKHEDDYNVDMSEVQALGEDLFWHGTSGHEIYDQLVDNVSSIPDETLEEMSKAISLVVNPKDNTAFESAALTNEELLRLPFYGMNLFGDAPVQEDYSGRGSYDWCYLNGGLSCEDISRGIMRMFGRVVDFTPIRFKKMPVPGVDIEAFKPFVYDGAFYYFSNESIGWFPYNSDIQHVYAIEDDLFFANASISLNEDEGPGIYYYGHVMAVFQKKDGHYQLLKIYPLNTFPPLDEVRRYAITAAPESNFEIDYTAAPEFTELTQYEDALKAALPAGGLNDAGNSAVTTYLEYAAQNYKPAVSRAKKNVVTISPEEAESAQSGALEAMTALRTVLQDENITLDREPAITARIDAGGLHPEEPLQIRIGKDTVDKLTSVDDLMILLQDSQHAVTIPVDDLKQAGELYIQIEKLSDSEYRISFLDESGKVLERSAVSVTFTVPAANELSTVQAIYGGNSDNWGGQYDLLNQTISFRTIYTGDYSILDSGIEIGDIDMLTPEQQRAIKFMVSRGYFDLDEDGNFSPGTVLNRYSFVRTLVKIFFALDRDAAATFTDVEESSPYYPYVASGQKEEVINGYEDNTFRGENDVLRWHVIAFCSRSLANKKGYARPADPSVYLNFVDNDVIETYKENDIKDIALAVREGLIDNGGVLRPNQEITKAEAAWMLYKLFMLLYEISPVPITIEEEALAGSGGGAGAPVLAGGVAAGGIGIAAAVYFVMKKKRLTVNK